MGFPPPQGVGADPYGFAPPQGWPTRLLLDDARVPAAAAAYSLRRLSLSYTGPLVKLREDAGDTLSDFSDVDANNVLRNASGQTVAAWLTSSGASAAYLRTFYDGSGNGRDLTETNTGLQPLYVASTSNGRPGFRFNNSRLTGADFSALTEGEVFAVLECDVDPAAALASSGLWWFGSHGSTTHHPYSNAAGTLYDGWGSTARKTVGDPAASLTDWHIWNCLSASGEWTARLNGSSIYTTGTNTVGFQSDCYLGWSNGSGVYFAGDMQEVVIFAADTDAARAAIYAEQASYYGVS